ncbi:cyclin-L1-1-like [Olea europaea var. sylvestris]|uniref:cyclin-L1-1-like n=1 Tax=Olea europaea var. sylvestris TaxID=158386 RepID=UPI000C1D788E|nr:cyclin-L1-1-like [Olea europaea var. sylvestris]
MLLLNNSSFYFISDGSLTGPAVNEDSSTAEGSSSAANQEVGKDVLVKAALDKMEELKSADDSKSMPTGEESREDPESKLMSDHRTEAGGESNKERDKDKDRDRDRERERTKSRVHDRGRESDRERRREDSERDRDKIKERGHPSRDKGKDSGRVKKSKHHSSRARLTHQGRRIAVNIICMHKLG